MLINAKTLYFFAKWDIFVKTFYGMHLTVLFFQGVRYSFLTL